MIDKETKTPSVSKKDTLGDFFAYASRKRYVRKATQNNIEEARALELKAAEIVFATEGCKIGLKLVFENHGVPNCEL
ncbi:hypothetical protein [Murdochiella massiliensis]|uniref:hypothetical protein n=1 Tax=Murdochiella massiliensis TaxID=1673723 RepID=UPI000AC326F5|nr:hypothetical protein [Murdochiella massiliensis]